MAFATMLGGSGGAGSVPGSHGPTTGPLNTSEPVCIYNKDHGKTLLEQLQLLRMGSGSGLVDLDLVCKDVHFKGHKSVLAAASRFLRDQLTKANCLVPVIVKLEEFGLHLNPDAVGHIVEFVYRGEVVIPGDRLEDMCEAVQALGIHSLLEFLQAKDQSKNRRDARTSSDQGSQGFVHLTANGGTVAANPPSAPGTPSQSVNQGPSNSNPNTIDNGPVELIDVTMDNNNTATSGIAQYPHNFLNLANSLSSTATNPYGVIHSAGPSVSYPSNEYTAYINPPPNTYPHQTATAGCSQEYPGALHDNSMIPAAAMVLQYASSATTTVQDVVMETMPIPGTSHQQFSSGSGLSRGKVMPALVQPPPPSNVPVTTSALGSESNHTTTICTTPPPSSSAPSTNPGATSTATTIAPSSAGKLRVINQGLLNTSSETNIQQDDSSSIANCSLNTPMPAGAESPSATWPQANVGPTATWPSADPDLAAVYEQTNSEDSMTATVGNWTHPTSETLTTTAGSSWNVPEPAPTLSTNSNSSCDWNSSREVQKLKPERIVSERSEANQHQASGTWHRLATGSEPDNEGTNNMLAPSPTLSTNEAISPCPAVSNQTEQPGSPRSFGQFPCDHMLAIRSGIPLHRRQRHQSACDTQSVGGSPKSPLRTANTRTRKSTGGNKRSDHLGIRKDLTLPTAPTAEEDNVFQPDEAQQSIRKFPPVELDVNVDCELRIHGNNETRNSASPEDLSANTAESDESKVRDMRCLQCDMTFSSQQQLRQHVKHAHYQDDIVRCKVCKAGFQGKDALRTHMFKVHAEGTLHRCEDCNYETPVKASFVRHNCIKSKPKFKCSKCPKEYKSKVGLKLHEKTHEKDGASLLKCSECGFSSPQKVGMIRHMAAIHKKDLLGNILRPDFKCSTCDEEFVSEYLLKQHRLRKHTARADMKHQCQLCDYASVEKASLEKHIRFKHTNERPYSCETCGFSTHTNSSMARHMQSHQVGIGKRPHVCDFCGLSYADKKRLRDHRLKHEKNDLSFDCDQCGASFKRKDNLKTHIERKHEVSGQPSGDNSEEDEEGLVMSEPKPKGRKKKISEDAAPTTSSQSHIVGHINHDGTIRPVSQNHTGQ